MPDCDRCGESFADERARLQHVRDVHPDDFGSIERRRLEQLADGDGSTNRRYVIAAVGVVVLVGVAAFLAFSGGDSNPPTPHAYGSVHYHGGIQVVIDGTELDFSRPEFQLQSDHFHFESGNGDRWHVHSKGVTLAYAMNTLGIEVTADSLTYQGTTYRDDEAGTRVRVRVNGESVDPRTYVLQPDDQIRIVVETG